MRRAFWTADFAEANIVAGLLRANGIEASVFDAGMAQLNWMETLAIGGYRVMVAEVDAKAAHDVVVAYSKGELEFSDQDIDPPACTNCGPRRTNENRNLRGAVFFLSWLGLGEILLGGMFVIFLGIVPLAFAVAPQVFAIFCIGWVLAVFVYLLRRMTQHHRCASCTNVQQAGASEFGALSRAVDAAQARATDRATD